MNLTLRRRLWCQQLILLKVSIPPCGFLLKMVVRWNKFVHCHYGWHGEVCVATIILSYVFIGNKIGTWSIEVYILLHVTFHSPSSNKFTKVVHDVVSNSPLHSRGIGLEGETCTMVLKIKLDGNSHRPNKDVCTINVPITNYLLPSTYQSLDMHACLHSNFKSTTKCWWHHLK